MGTIEPHVFVELYAGEGDPEYFNEEEHTQVTNGCHRGYGTKPGSHYEGVPAYSSVAVASSGFPISRQLRNFKFNKWRRDMVYIPSEKYLIWRPLPGPRKFLLIEAILASFKKNQLHYRCSQISYLARFSDKKRQTVDFNFFRSQE